MTTPPPTPVPTVSITRNLAPQSWASASAATLASLSTNTGRPRRSRRTSRSGTSSSGMFTLERTRPFSQSTTDGTPSPTAATSSSPAASWIMRTSCSSRSSGESSCVGSMCGSPSSPSERTATETLVPPTSTPIRRSPTAGILSRPLPISGDRLANQGVDERAGEQDARRQLEEGHQHDDRRERAEGRAHVGDVRQVEAVDRPRHEPADDHQRGAEADPAQRLGLCGAEADEQPDGEPQCCGREHVAQDRGERGELQDRGGGEHARARREPEPDRREDALAQRALLVVPVVDAVERAHDRPRRGGQLPEQQREAGGHPEELAAAEDRRGRGVEDVVHRGRHLRRDLRREVLRPQRVQRQGARQREREQRQRDEREQGAEGDPTGADEQLVPAKPFDHIAERGNRERREPLSERRHMCGRYPGEPTRYRSRSVESCSRTCASSRGIAAGTSPSRIVSGSWPPSRAGEMVKNSSSTAPEAKSGPLIVGPPSHRTECTPWRSRRSASIAGGSIVSQRTMSSWAAQSSGSRSLVV